MSGKASPRAEDVDFWILTPDFWLLTSVVAILLLLSEYNALGLMN
jgi:hypothetical protein